MNNLKLYIHQKIKIKKKENLINKIPRYEYTKISFIMPVQKKNKPTSDAAQKKRKKSHEKEINCQRKF
jgi:hypothetical protein